jgi:hypothetical protein
MATGDELNEGVRDAPCVDRDQTMVGLKGVGVPLGRPAKRACWGGNTSPTATATRCSPPTANRCALWSTEDTIPTLDDQGRQTIGPVEIPPGGELIVGA